MSERPDDRELVVRARTGDVDAFAELIRLHEQRVRGVLVRLLDDPRDVEEATQDTFVQAWRNLGRYRGDAAVFTWLYRIAVNEALGRLRRRRPPVTGLDESLAASADRPEEIAHQGELRRALHAALARLPLEHRAPLVLRDVVGLTNEEVAAVLELSVPAAKSRIHRARLQVRADLAARGLV